jgi:hypothetical protein
MNYEVYIIHQNPFGILISFMSVGYFPANPFDLILYIKSAIAFTCVGFEASQIRKKSAMASGIFRISREMMFSPFFPGWH